MSFIINLSPQVSAGAVEVLGLERLGEILQINGEDMDLSFMSPGDHLPAGAIEHPLLKGATITRHVDSIEIDQLLFHVAVDQTDPAACFPAPIVINEDGPVSLPPQLPPPEPVLELSPESEPESELEPHAESKTKEATDADQY